MIGKKQTGLWGIASAALVAGALLLPASASAEERLPNLEGTTYGVMLNDLQAQLDKLEAASSSEYGMVLHETALVMAEQNKIMIRMIDALHDKVNGLIEEDQSSIDAGYRKFEMLGEEVDVRHLGG